MLLPQLTTLFAHGEGTPKRDSLTSDARYELSRVIVSIHYKRVLFRAFMPDDALLPQLHKHCGDIRTNHHFVLRLACTSSFLRPCCAWQ